MMRLKKFFCTGLIMGMMLPQVISGGDISEAATGTWKQDSKGWWYAYADGSYAKNEWVQFGGKWYYFNASGYMVTGWKKIGKKWYYFNAAGEMITGWKKISGKWYFFNTSGAMITGWKQSSKKWYYFNSDGTMATGWKQLSGNWYYFESSGEMVTGTKVIGGVTYEFGSDGAWIDNSGTSEFANAQVGDIIKFGKYEQDNNAANGKEDIEWQVLDKRQDGSLLVISKYGLDCKRYNEVYNLVTWETCTLRTWLNTTFLNEAFSSDEKAMIPKTTVTNNVEMYEGPNGGNDTEDQVFLLSTDEVTTYFAADSDWLYGPSTARECKPTAYAAAQGAWTSEDDEDYGNCWWWLRSPGGTLDTASGVTSIGLINYYGVFVNCEGFVLEGESGSGSSEYVVRPALIINP